MPEERTDGSLRGVAVGAQDPHYALRIRHAVADYSAWKAAFDRDPVGREAHGVRRYRVLRTVDDSSCVSIDLEFDSQREAKAFLSLLNELWRNVAGAMVGKPDVRLEEIAEVRVLGTSPP